MLLAQGRSDGVFARRRVLDEDAIGGEQHVAIGPDEDRRRNASGRQERSWRKS
jgi:hypothetical protein